MSDHPVETRIVRLIIALLGCFVLASPALAAPLARELNTNMSLYIVNAANNNEAFFGNAPFQSDSLGMDPALSLFTADAVGVIWNITVPATPFPVGPTTFTQIGDLDWANNGLWGFSNASTTLFFFDITLGSVTSSNVITGLGGATVTGVAYEPATGDIYLSINTGLNTDQLAVVPFATTAANVIGSMSIGDAASYVADIDFDGASGNLYAMTFFHRYFYTVNTTTAATTLVSTGPHRDTTAMALNPVSVPEPATLTVVSIGALALARRKRR